MVTNVFVRNFKKLEDISFPLSQSAVLIGPNNAGKSTLFQALCLWETGVTNFIQANQKKDLDKNGAVTINRGNLLNSPVPDARFLWRDRKVTEKLCVELRGEDYGQRWECRAEFEFSNAESFSCKIVSGLAEIAQLYNAGKGIHFGFLQPMSGISTHEDKLTQGSIGRKLGEGKTAEVLRNICYGILYPDTPRPGGYDPEEKWATLCKGIKRMFGAELQKPEFIRTTGLIQLEYTENDIRYDISSGGRGFLQTLLLLAYMYAHPNTILLLDEPDAHLEVIRQREAFHFVSEVANEMNSQILMASHSETVLDEAAESSNILALIENKVFELNKASSPQQLKYIKKTLTEIGWEKYYQARAKGHVLYLEGSTDLQMLLHFAAKLGHRVEPLLRQANVQYTSDNVPGTAINNFVSLQAIFSGLKGLALFDNLPNLADNPKLRIICWTKRELENYFAKPDILYKYAQLPAKDGASYSQSEMLQIMQQTVEELTVPLYLKNLTHEWWNKAKLSDDWLDVIFPEFYKRAGLPQDFYKRDYYRLINLMETTGIDEEITEKLDILYEFLSC